MKAVLIALQCGTLSVHCLGTWSICRPFVNHHLLSLSLVRVPVVPCLAGSAHSHHTSLREQLQFTTPIAQQSTTNSNATILSSNGGSGGVGPGAPGGHKNSIFGRLGIRKPSILSLSSPQPSGGAAARTFSLDDLLRPPPRRKTDNCNFLQQLDGGYAFYLVPLLPLLPD